MEEGRLGLFVRHGTEEERIEVAADDVLNAIAEGRDIDIEYAIIDGDLDISKIEYFLERDKDGKWIAKRYTIRGYIKIWHSEIRGKAGFRAVDFRGGANFEGTTFIGDASFSEANFKGYTIFNKANFSENASFTDAAFGSSIDLNEAIFNGNADFDGCDFSDQVIFNRAEFKGDTKFIESIFKDVTRFNEARFNGNTYFNSATFGEYTSFSLTVFSRMTDFSSAAFSGKVDFGNAIFDGDVDFINAAFIENADFRFVSFRRRADFSFGKFAGHMQFWSATFSGFSDFSGATFIKDAVFASVYMERPASFSYLSFREDTVRKRLWNHVLCPIVWLITIGKVKAARKTVTDFSGFNTATVMDGSSNPYLKRYIDDEQWIRSWRERGWWRRWPLFILWEAMSHCGRSIGLWAFWSAVIATAFAFIYRWFGSESIAFSIDKLGGGPGFWGYLYYSVVTFTTLGFGDIVPLTNPARLAVGAEVVLGYVMLGGLISIFANKFARRS